MPQLAEILAGIKDAALLINYLNSEGKLLIDDIDKSFVNAATTQDLPPALISSFLKLELPRHTALPAADLERACDAAVALGKHTPVSGQLETQALHARSHLRRASKVTAEIAALASSNAAKLGSVLDSAPKLSGVFITLPASSSEATQQQPQPLLHIIPDAAAPSSTTFSLPGDHQAHSTYTVVATESIADSLIPNQDSLTLTCVPDPADSAHWVIIGGGPVIPSWSDTTTASCDGRPSGGRRSATLNGVVHNSLSAAAAAAVSPSKAAHGAGGDGAGEEEEDTLGEEWDRPAQGYQGEDDE